MILDIALIWVVIASFPGLSHVFQRTRVLKNMGKAWERG